MLRSGSCRDAPVSYSYLELVFKLHYVVREFFLAIKYRGHYFIKPRYAERWQDEALDEIHSSMSTLSLAPVTSH